MEEIYNYLTELAQIKDSFLTLVNCGFKKPEEMAACRERTKAQYEKAWEILNGQKSPETIMQWESKVVYGIIPEALLKADMDDRNYKNDTKVLFRKVPEPDARIFVGCTVFSRIR